MPKEQCTKIIREKLPHLQELSFGCEVYEFGTKRKVKFLSCFSVNDDTQQDSVNYFDGQVIKTLNSWWLIKDNIIGHPIQINDWLGLLGNDYAIAGDGWLLENGRDDVWYAQWHGSSPVKYDPSKPFDQQEEPFYRFLLENIT